YPWAPFRVNISRVEGTPEKTKITGTIAYTLPDSSRLAIMPQFDFDKVKKSIDAVSRNIASASGTVAKVVFDIGYPPLVTDRDATEVAIQAIERILGEGHAIPVDMTLGGEDFSLYLQKVPGTYILMGTNNKELGYESMLHTSTFNFSDKVLPIGSLILAEIAKSASQIYRNQLSDAIGH
ncbi:MAG: M20/M25/M40 family metallo-hydrolase, partial [Candidatus Parvarchaeota archaeon]